ncbi:MAG: Uma2 family endonuclease [Waterburya sp.]
MTAQLTKTTLSLEDFLILPETKPYIEYIDEKLFPKPMPQGEHSTIQAKLTAIVNNNLLVPKIGSAFTELRCTFGGRSLVPDISVFEWGRIPKTENKRIANRFEIAPDWVIEILSPEQSSTSVIEKIIFCLQHGTKLGWFIDPAEESVMVFEGDRRPTVFRNASPLPVLGDWQISATDIFALLTFED